MREEIIYFDNVVDDVVYYISTNAADNFKVIDQGSPDDYWFHAKDCSSCHVVVNVPEYIDKKGLRTIIQGGARLCKQNTKKLTDLITPTKDEKTISC